MDTRRGIQTGRQTDNNIAKQIDKYRLADRH